MYKLGAYWGPREESAEECAERLHRYFLEIAQISDVFAAWFKKGYSRKQASQHQVDVSDRSQVLELIEAGRNRRDFGGEVIEELGFQIGLWNAQEAEKSVGLRVMCGLYADIPGLSGNVVLLGFPARLDELGELGTAKEVVAATVRCWEPEWAGVFSDDAMRSRAFDALVPFIDWIVYVCDPSSLPERLPKSVSAAHIDDLGWMVALCERAPHPEDLVHLRRVQEVERALSM